jgi:hypothetical protein
LYLRLRYHHLQLLLHHLSFASGQMTLSRLGVRVEVKL